MYQTANFLEDHSIQHFNGSQTSQTSVLLKFSELYMKITPFKRIVNQYYGMEALCTGFMGQYIPLPFKVFFSLV